MAARPHGTDEPTDGPVGGAADDRPESTPGRRTPGPGDGRPVPADEPADAGPSRPGPDSPEPPRGAEAPDADERTSDAAADLAGAAAGEPRSAPDPTDRPADDLDARWREIVEQLADIDLTDPAPPPGPAAGPGDGGATSRSVGPRTVRPAAPRSWSPDPELEEAEDHFEPPDPGPVLGGDPLLTMAWAAVVGVPLLFIAMVVLWPDAPSVLLTAAGVAFLAGVGLLVWRMPHRRDDDDGPGAVV